MLTNSLQNNHYSVKLYSWLCSDKSPKLNSTRHHFNSSFVKHTYAKISLLVSQKVHKIRNT